MQDQQEISRHPDPRNMPGKQWLVVYEDQRGQRSIDAYATVEQAKAEAWRIVDEIAEAAQIDIEDAYAAGDLWGAWDAVCGGNGSLTIEQIDLPAA